MMPCREERRGFFVRGYATMTVQKFSRKVLTRFMLVSKIRRSAFGVRRSAFGVRRSAFGVAVLV